MKQHEVFRVEVAGTAHSIEQHLNAAEKMARERAQQEGRCGILITQHHYTSFTVALCEDVPFGQTREKREWRHAPTNPHAPRATEPTGPAQQNKAILVHTAWAGWSYEAPGPSSFE